MPNPTRTLDDELFPVGRHEGAHALHGLLVGHEIESVHVSARGAHTVIVYPTSPAMLASYFRQHPALWSCELAKIIGTIRAGSLFEGCSMYGEDLASLETWHDAYVASCGDESDWQQLCAGSFASLQRWYRHEAVCTAVNTLTGMLIRQQETSKYAFMDMCGLAQAGSLPDPWYEAALPSTQRWPHGSRLSAPPTAVGVDVRTFARDPHGRVRPMTESEWCYAIAHRTEFARILGDFSEPEMDILVSHMSAAVARQEASVLVGR